MAGQLRSRRRTVEKRFALGWSLARAWTGLQILGTCLNSVQTSAQVVGRWGQASLLLTPSPEIGPTFMVFTGKQFVAGQTVTSTPTAATSLALFLNESIENLGNPPWTEAPSGPVAAYGSALALTSSNALFFGGDAVGDPLVPVQSQNDSSWLLSYSSATTASWSRQPSSWAGQPSRREMHYFASATNGTASRAWIFGGVRADGSGIGSADLWELTLDVRAADDTLSNGRWSQWAGRGQSPPVMWDGQAVLVPSGGIAPPTMYLLGGMQEVNGVESLMDFSNMWAFTPGTGPGSGSWTSLELNSRNAPTGRRGHVAVSVGNGLIWIHGGRNLDGTMVFSDSALLDTKRRRWTSTTAGPAVWGHSAVSIGDTVLMAFGYGSNAPASSELIVYAPGNDSYLDQYSPSYLEIIPNPKSGPDATTIHESRSSDVAGSVTASSALDLSTADLSSPTATATSPVAPPSQSASAGPAPWVAPGGPVSQAGDSSIGDNAADRSSQDDGGDGAPSRKQAVTGAVVGSVIGALALVVVAGALVIRQRRRQGRRGRPYPSARDRHYGDDAFADEMGHSGLIAASDNSREKPLPVPTVMRSVTGGGVRSAIVGLWKQAGGTPRAREGRFALLEDEESERWNSANGRGAPSNWTAFFDEDAHDEKQAGAGLGYSMAGRGGRGVWDSFDFGASGKAGKVVSDTVKTSTSFLGSALGGFAAVPQRDALDDDEIDSSNRGMQPKRTPTTSGRPVLSAIEEDTGSSNGHSGESGWDHSTQTHLTSSTGEATVMGGASNADLAHVKPSSVPHRSFSPGVTSLYGSTFNLNASGGLRRDIVSRSSSNGSHNLQRSNSNWWSLLSRKPTYASQPTSTANERIRDPAPAPVIDTAQSGLRAASEADRDPFTDEHGQLDQEVAHQHYRSLSSTASSAAGTATSSVMEERMKHMDVVQRVHESSDGTISSADATPTMPSALDGVFDPLPHSNDHFEVKHATRQHVGTTAQGRVVFVGDLISSPVAESRRNPFEDPPPISPSKRVRGPRPAPVTVPAITIPSPTKTRPTSASAATVRAMVEKIERSPTKTSSSSASPLPNSWSMGSLSNAIKPGHGRRATMGSSASMEEVAEPARRSRVAHGLAKKPLLFVANPDRE